MNTFDARRFRGTRVESEERPACRRDIRPSFVAGSGSRERRTEWADRRESVRGVPIEWSSGYASAGWFRLIHPRTSLGARSVFVIVDAPALEEVTELLAVENLVTEPAAKAHDPSVLPR